MIPFVNPPAVGGGGISQQQSTQIATAARRQPVASIAALKALTPTIGDAVNVTGYAAAGDGGDGTFFYDSTSVVADNGGTIIAPNAGGGRWIRAFSGPVNVRWFGAKGDGTTDDTLAWEAAMAVASGGGVAVPRGSYVLLDCEIPQTAGCDIIPEGGAEVLVPRGATYGGLMFRGDLNFSSATTVTDVSVVTNYKTQSVTKISGAAGAFSAYSANDICVLYCDTIQTIGVADAEAFAVLSVAVDGSYIYANRVFINSYNAGTSTVRVRRATAKPRIRIREGLTMRPNGDPTAAGAKSTLIRLLCPIEADVSVHFQNMWNIGLWMTNSWRGRYNITWQDVHVDYAIAAYGYIVNLQGASYAPDFVLRGSKGGHAITVGARTGALIDENWFYYGVPFGHYVHDSVVHNNRRAAFDEHVGYHGIFSNCVVLNAKLDDLEYSNQQDAFALSSLNTTVVSCVADGVKAFFSTSNKDYGKTNTISIINPIMRSRGTAGVTGLLNASGHIPDYMTVMVRGGMVDVDAVGIIDAYKIRAIVSDVTFLNCSRLFNLSAANSELSVLNCVYVPNSNSLSYAGTVGLSTQTLTIDNLHVSVPSEIAHVAQIVQAGATVRMGRVTCPTALGRFTGQTPTVVDIVTATS